jgi:arylsulfatase A-like enzyme
MSNSLSILFSSLLILGLPAFSAERPNVLWFVIDDMSSHFSCYGETAIQTPHTDRLAAAGMRFTNTHVTAPVCSTSRSAMITGMYQTSLRAHHHRSGRGEIKIHLPEGVKLAPELFQEAGYFTCIGSGLPDKDLRGLAFPANTPPKRRFGKTDYNFEWDPAVYDSHDWADCPPDKPFFMQVQLHGGKMRLDSLEHNLALQERARAELGSHTDPASVTLPPYYPDHPTLRQDWAAYLDSVRLTDHHIGLVIERLQQENRLQNTFIIVMTDHGISHARGKQFLYTEGTQIPFILSGPGVASGLVRDDLVEHIDMLPTSLAVASISIPTAI